MAKREGNNGNHGVPGRSGRKPYASTLLKRRLQAEKFEDAERAYAFYVAIMDNEEENTDLRLAAADRILDRILGKATQQVRADVNAVSKVEIITRRIGDDGRNPSD